MSSNRQCEWCDKSFTAGTSFARFCSGRCRAASHRANGGTKQAVSASKPPQRPSKPPIEYSDTLVDGVAELRSQVASEGLLSPVIEQKLRRMANIAAELDDQPNQPGLYGAYLALERDVEAVLPRRQTNEFTEAMRSLWFGQPEDQIPEEYRLPTNEETT